MRPTYAVVVATVLLAATACGGSPGTATTTDQDVEVPDATQQPLQDRTFPGATGEIADIDGRTLQVQNPVEGQVAVTWTRRTDFTQEVDATADDLEVGDCVMVDGEGGDVIEASSVRITPAVDGSCAPQGGWPQLPGGPPPGDAPAAEAPGDLPAPGPDGAPDRMVMAGAFGRVSAVSDTGFTVETTMPGETGTTSRQVTASGATTWTDTVGASSDALEVGACVTARGEHDETGAVTADTIAVSQPVEGECLGGTVRRFEVSR